MPDSSPPRFLGDTARLLDPFDRTFEQGGAEIPENIDRSRQNIGRIQKASSKGKASVEGFLKTRAGLGKQSRRDLKKARRSMRWTRLHFRLVMVARRGELLWLKARRVWSRFWRRILVLLVAVGLVYGAFAYRADISGLVSRGWGWIAGAGSAEVSMRDHEGIHLSGSSGLRWGQG
nr:hypothetical protein [uncultured Cohaesibacter sp.]